MPSPPLLPYEIVLAAEPQYRFDYPGDSPLRFFEFRDWNIWEYEYAAGCFRVAGSTVYLRCDVRNCGETALRLWLPQARLSPFDRSDAEWDCRQFGFSGALFVDGRWDRYAAAVQARIDRALRAYERDPDPDAAAEIVLPFSDWQLDKPQALDCDRLFTLPPWLAYDKRPRGRLRWRLADA